MLAGSVVLVVIAYVCFELKGAQQPPDEHAATMRNFYIAAAFAIGAPLIATFHAFYIEKPAPSKKADEDEWS